MRREYAIEFCSTLDNKFAGRFVTMRKHDYITGETTEKDYLVKNFSVPSGEEFPRWLVMHMYDDSAKGSGYRRCFLPRTVAERLLNEGKSVHFIDNSGERRCLRNAQIHPISGRESIEITYTIKERREA